MKKLVSIIAVLVVGVLLLLPATSVLAISDPDTDPQVTAVYVFEDVLEDGDLGVLVDYYLDYDFTVPITGTPVPDETVTEAYLTVFIDTNGTTQLKSVAPYTFIYSGYGRGIAWIYFTAAEVTAASIDDANEALYRVWLIGNPTVPSGWTGDPPKTVASVDNWYAADELPVFSLTMRVLYLADQIELAWDLDLVAQTPLGARLTTLGEGYFSNAINNLRAMAPGCFSVSTIYRELEDIDYSTTFGATIEDGTGSLPVSPLTLVEGDNTVNIDGAGTFILELEKGTKGEAVSIAGGCTVDNSPVALVAGSNTITTNLAGTKNILVTVSLDDTASGIWALVEGGVFDTTEVAELFGMTHWMFAGLIWMAISVVICAAYYKGSSKFGTGGGKGVMIIFDICIVLGVALGMLNILVGVLLFIGFSILTGYILFYRRASF